jgi:hypothetical protein
MLLTASLTGFQPLVFSQIFLETMLQINRTSEGYISSVDVNKRCPPLTSALQSPAIAQQ